jgi:YggT family protein
VRVRIGCAVAAHAAGQTGEAVEYVGMPTCAQSLLSCAADTWGGRKDRAVLADVLGIVLQLFELVLIARMVVDWVGVLSPVGGRSGLYQARRITHGITEPVIGPVRRVLKPVRLGSVSVDLAFTAVFVAVIVLRTVVVPLIPF